MWAILQELTNSCPAREYHSQMVFFGFIIIITIFIIFSGHYVIDVINMKCLTWYICVKYVPHIPHTLKKCMSQGYKLHFKMNFLFYFQVGVL